MLNLFDEANKIKQVTVAEMYEGFQEEELVEGLIGEIVAIVIIGIVVIAE